MKATLIVTRGASGSGKSTKAWAWQREAEGVRAVVERDGIRQLLFGRDYPLHEDSGVAYQLETVVTSYQRAAVRGLLEAGISVCVSDTNLKASYVRPWRELATDIGAGFEVWTDFAYVSVEECLTNNLLRKRQVPEPVIRLQHARLLSSLKTEREAEDARPSWAYSPHLLSAWIVDVDGTVALMDGRGPFEWHRVEEDQPNEPVIALVRALVRDGYAIVFVSGRDEVCRPATERWLQDKVLRNRAPLHLFMRPAGNNVGDEKIKREIFLRDVAPKWNVIGVLDDRAKVVRMWRSLGLTCAQVAPGAF